MPVLPTLALGPEQLLTDPQSIILYTLRSVFLNPGFTSSMIEDEIVSFRKLQAEFGNNGELLAQKVEIGINDIFTRYFSDTSIITASVTHEQIDTNKYKLQIEVNDSKGQLKIIRSRVHVDNENELIIKFEEEN